MRLDGQRRSLTGSVTDRRFVSVKLPISTAPSVIQRGSPPKVAMLASMTPSARFTCPVRKGEAGMAMVTAKAMRSRASDVIRATDTDVKLTIRVLS